MFDTIQEHLFLNYKGKNTSLKDEYLVTDSYRRNQFKVIDVVIAESNHFLAFIKDLLWTYKMKH